MEYNAPKSWFRTKTINSVKINAGPITVFLHLPSTYGALAPISFELLHLPDAMLLC